MDSYEQALVSAMTSSIKKRAGKITSLEMFRQGYYALGRLKDKRDVEHELESLRLDQVVQKRALAMLTNYRRENAYLNAIVDELAVAEYV